MIVIAKDALPTLLRKQRAYLNSLTLRLFVNDLTPDKNTVAADFDEAAFPGYASQPVADFTSPYLNDDDEGEMHTATHVFTHSATAGAEDVYGYYVTDPTGYLIFSERAGSGPITMDTPGQSYPVVITWRTKTLD